MRSTVVVRRPKWLGDNRMGFGSQMILDLAEKMFMKLGVRGGREP
jgi:hypothetical protein